MSSFLVWFLLVLSLFPPGGFSEIMELPKARASYWAQGGTNLVGERYEQIPFLERHELFGLLKEKDRVLFLDIREPSEFEKSHLPKAFNISFASRASLYDQLKTNPNQIVVPYCNWDFRGYIAAIELKRKGIANVRMMYPHGLRGWIAQGLPVAGREAGKTDEEAFRLLNDLLATKMISSTSSAREMADPSSTSMGEGRSSARHILLRILPKIVEPAHIEASRGDRLTVDLIAEEEDHWFVIPDFGVNLHLKKGEEATVTLNLTRAGYFPMGCISCCIKYQCKIKQAILVDFKESLTAYGE